MTLGPRNVEIEQFETADAAITDLAGEVDYLLEVVVPDLEHYQRYLVGKLLNLPIIREVRSSIAIQTLKAGAPLPLDHLNTKRA